MTVWSNRLRTELCERAREYAMHAGAPSYQSLGTAAVVLFPPDSNGTTHGNFHPQSFGAIAANAEWASRLRKPHTRRAKALPDPYSVSACEMDSCTSSDALLMNIMAYPGVVTGDVAALLGVQRDASPHFGVPGVVPLRGGGVDATEVDMRIGDTNVEAKLTEASFTSKAISVVERYADLYEVFDQALLPRSSPVVGDAVEYLSYQLIRNVVAIARRPETQFRVLLDGRRPDLHREWWRIHGAIRDGSLRARCDFVLWQELALASPAPLREFLSLKYGL